MFNREFGLVRNPDTSERFVRLVRWELRWSSVMFEGELCEEASVVPVMVIRLLLERSEGGHKMLPVRITELSMRRWPVIWPRDVEGESEALRRSRLRAARRATHVDECKGAAEPTWVELASVTNK